MSGNTSIVNIASSMPLSEISELSSITGLSWVCEQLFERVSHIVYIADGLGNIVRTNSLWQRLTGIPIVSVLGMPFLQFFHPEEQLILQARWNQGIRHQVAWQERARLMMADGSYEWFLIVSQPFPGTSVEENACPEDQSAHWFCTVSRCPCPTSDSPLLVGQDSWEAIFEHVSDALVAANAEGLASKLLEMRIAERTAELAEREALFRTTFEQSAIGCAHLDLDGRWMEINQKICEIVGYTREELLQKTFQDVTHPEDLAEDLAHVAQLLAGTIPNFSLEKRYIRGDGSIIWVRITASLRRRAPDVAHPLGEPVHFISMVEDISDRKQWELRDEENRQILENTKQVLEKRNQELDQFVYIVSHDLKAPLRGISNLSEWLEEDLSGQLPPDNQVQLELLRSRVKRMDNLINGLLQYSRVGREGIIVTFVDVGELLLEIIDSLAPPPTFTIELPKVMPQLKTQRLLLSQVFTNLLSNAIKHHDRATGKIELHWTEQVNDYVFSVTDDGPGIPLDQQKRVFGIFQTMTSSDASDNTGIGLALVKKIVEDGGGQITLRPRGDRGCCFEFTWPKFCS